MKDNFLVDSVFVEGHFGKRAKQYRVEMTSDTEDKDAVASKTGLMTVVGQRQECLKVDECI